jgi:hypothetical protein
MIQIPDDFQVTDEFRDMIHKIEVDRICQQLQLDDKMSDLMARRVPHLRQSEVEAVLQALRQVTT